MIKTEFGYKYHWAVADYLQRSARHIASQTDVDQAYAVGRAAVDPPGAGGAFATHLVDVEVDLETGKGIPFVQLENSNTICMSRRRL